MGRPPGTLCVQERWRRGPQPAPGCVAADGSVNAEAWNEQMQKEYSRLCYEQKQEPAWSNQMQSRAGLAALVSSLSCGT